MKRDENIVAKEEIAHHEQFLLLPQCCQKLSAANASESGKGLIQSCGIGEQRCRCLNVLNNQETGSTDCCFTLFSRASANYCYRDVTCHVPCTKVEKTKIDCGFLGWVECSKYR